MLNGSGGEGGKQLRAKGGVSCGTPNGNQGHVINTEGEEKGSFNSPDGKRRPWKTGEKDKNL